MLACAISSRPYYLKLVELTCLERLRDYRLALDQVDVRSLVAIISQSIHLRKDQPTKTGAFCARKEAQRSHTGPNRDRKRRNTYWNRRGRRAGAVDRKAACMGSRGAPYHPGGTDISSSLSSSATFSTFWTQLCPHGIAVLLVYQCCLLIKYQPDFLAAACVVS